MRILDKMKKMIIMTLLSDNDVDDEYDYDDNDEYGDDDGDDDYC